MFWKWIAPLRPGELVFVVRDVRNCRAREQSAGFRGGNDIVLELAPDHEILVDALIDAHDFLAAVVDVLHRELRQPSWRRRY